MFGKPNQVNINCYDTAETRSKIVIILIPWSHTTDKQDNIDD